MWSIPGAGTAYPALQVGVSPLPLHGEKKPLGKRWGELARGCWAAGELTCLPGTWKWGGKGHGSIRS